MDRRAILLAAELYRGSYLKNCLRLAFALGIFAAFFIAHIAPASAQVQAYTYSGPSYSFADCGSIPGQCLPAGSVSAAIIFQSAPDTGSGGTILAWSMTGTGIGTLGTSDTLSGGFGFTGGQLTTWDMSGTSNPSADIAIITRSGAGNYDEAVFQHSISGPEGIVFNPPQGHWAGGKILGIACARPGACSAGEPIDIGSGNMFDTVTDYTTAGQNPLALIRYYNSMAVPDTSAVSMGANWRTNYDRYLHIFSTSAVAAERADGQTVGFYLAGSGIWMPDSDVDLKLTNSGSTWTLTDQNDTKEIYTAASGKGTLNSITQRNGYTQALTYSGSQISFVSDSYGRKLGFSYTGSLLTSITTPDTATLTYGYVAFSSTNLLTSVTYNTSPATSQTYLYENVSYPFTLTGITDENGARYATWAYDGSGRAISSQLAGAVNFTSVSYDDTTGNRTVTGPLGILETYKFSYLQGVPKVTEIDRAANGTVASASETFAYDTNGYTSSKTDWNGDITGWVNNSHGLPTQIVYASTTTNAQTTNIAYDATWPHLPYSIATNGVTAALIYDSAHGNTLTRTLTDTTSGSTAGQKRTWNYTWTPTGQLLTVQLPRTDVTAKTTFAYTGGTLTSVTDALSHITSVVSYQSGGLPLKVYDPNGVPTTLAYM
jgi:hypothetical protein